MTAREKACVGIAETTQLMSSVPAGEKCRNEEDLIGEAECCILQLPEGQDLDGEEAICVNCETHSVAGQCKNQKASTWRRLRRALSATLKDSCIERTAERDVEADQKKKKLNKASRMFVKTSLRGRACLRGNSDSTRPPRMSGALATQLALPGRSNINIRWLRGQSCAASLVRTSSRKRVRSWSANAVASERSRSSSSW